MGAPGSGTTRSAAAQVSAEHARDSRRLETFRDARARRRGPRAPGRAGRGGPGDRRASSRSRSRASRSASAALEEERLFSGPLRRRRRARHRQRRRRRHRRPGLGGDGPAHGDALGREARLRRRAARGLARGRRRASSPPPSASRARTPTASTAPRRACTAWCASRPSTPPTAARRASPASRSRPSSRTPARSRSTTTTSRSTPTGPAGAGGQHVNKTDSAVRITHRPTRHRRPVPERALAVLQQGRRRWTMLRSQAGRARGAQAPGGDRAGEGRGAGRQLRLADPLLRPAPVHDGQGPPHRRRDGRRPARARRRPRRLRARLPAAREPAGVSGEARARRADARRARRRRCTPAAAARTWTRSSPTASAARRASTCPATRAARAPTRACAPRSATDALALDVPQDIEGIDLGPSPTPVRARRGSWPPRPTARARTWFLTNGATQGNHALCLALAPPGRRGGRPAQLARQPRRRAGAERRRRRSSWRPSTTPSSGWRTASRPRRSPRRSPRAARGPRRVHRLADLLRDGRRRRRAAREVAHAAGAALVVDSAWGPHFGFHPALPPLARWPRAPTRCSPPPTRSSAASPSRRCCTSPATGRVDVGARRAGGAARALDQPELRCCWPRWTPRGASSPCTARRC